MIVALVACGSVRSGTAVGNPGDLEVEARSLDTTVALTGATLPLDAVTLVGCGWPGVDLAPERVLDALGDDPVGVPPGVWCGLRLVPAGPLVVEGATAAGTLFHVELALGVALDAALRVDGDRWLLDLPLPLDGPALDALGADVVLDAADPLAAAWAEATVPALWEDLDQDGLLDPDDRLLVAAQRLDTGLGPLPSAYASSGCGCASATPGPAWLALLALGFARRRQDRPLRPADRGGG